MGERWSAPVIPLTIEPSSTDGIHLDGVARADVEIVLKDSDVDRLRLGYVCMKCLEPHPEAFPTACRVCGYRMRKFQAEDFAKDFAGVRWLGPTTTVDDEIEAMRERKARETHNPNSSIWVPPSAA